MNDLYQVYKHDQVQFKQKKTKKNPKQKQKKPHCFPVKNFWDIDSGSGADNQLSNTQCYVTRTILLLQRHISLYLRHKYCKIFWQQIKHDQQWYGRV